jgi:four helix bundle protein
MKKQKGTLVGKSFLMALEVIRVFKYLSEEKREYVMSKQLLRSGTAVGALIREAQNAESKKDFIHKLGIAQKECDETLYWVDLVIASEYIDPIRSDALRNQSEELLRMLKSAILTSKNNLHRK